MFLIRGLGVDPRRPVRVPRVLLVRWETLEIPSFFFSFLTIRTVYVGGELGAAIGVSRAKLALRSGFIERLGIRGLADDPVGRIDPVLGTFSLCFELESPQKSRCK